MTAKNRSSRENLTQTAWAVKIVRLLLVMLVFGAASPSDAGDWPQILGPHRNGVATGEKLPATFPAGWPKEHWNGAVGSGFAGPAVVGGRVIVFHRQQDQEIAEARDAASGKTLWKSAFPAAYQAQIVQDDGPLCVPVVSGERVFLFGAAANLHCVSLADGKSLWSRDLRKEFQVPSGYFGSGSTPLVEGNRLLVNVGARECGLAAFDVADGTLLWKATDELGSYSSPIAADLGGQRQVIFLTRYNAVGVAPATGKELFRLPFGKRGPTVNGASPVVLGDGLFLTSSYGLGAVWARFTGATPQVAWANDTTLSSQYTTPIAYDGRLYGIDGRQEVGVAGLRCVEPQTGKVVWAKEEFGKATLILVENRLLAVKTDGTLVVVAAQPKQYEELATARLSDDTIRALPALSNGQLYVRDGSKLRCFGVGAE